MEVLGLFLFVIVYLVSALSVGIVAAAQTNLIVAGLLFLITIIFPILNTRNRKFWGSIWAVSIAGCSIAAYGWLSILLFVAWSYYYNLWRNINGSNPFWPEVASRLFKKK